MCCPLYKDDYSDLSGYLHGGVDVGAPADELVDDRQVAALARHEQWRATVLELQPSLCNV